MWLQLRCSGMVKACAWAVLGAGAALHAQDVPSGWKTVTDRQKTCRIAVPADWTSDKLVASFVQSADDRSSAVAHGLRAGQSFAEAVTMAKQVMTPSKMIEDSGKRVWYAYQDNGGSSATNWYVAVAGDPVCTAQISFKDAAVEGIGKKIALSLTQGK